MIDKKRDLLDIIKITAILVLITVIAGALLGVVNNFTQIDNEAVLNKKLNEFYKSEQGFSFIEVGGLINDGGDITKSGSIKTIAVPKDGTNTVIFIAEGSGAYKATLQIILSIKDNVVTEIGKYASEETPGLGTKAFEDKYLNQFKGIDVALIQKYSLSTNKGIGDIVAVSGATKSSNAVLNAVNVSVFYYKNCFDKIVGGAL